MLVLGRDQKGSEQTAATLTAGPKHRSCTSNVDIILPCLCPGFFVGFHSGSSVWTVKTGSQIWSLTKGIFFQNNPFCVPAWHVTHTPGLKSWRVIAMLKPHNNFKHLILWSAPKILKVSHMWRRLSMRYDNYVNNVLITLFSWHAFLCKLFSCRAPCRSRLQISQLLHL